MLAMMTAVMSPTLVVPLICLGLVPMRSRTGMRLFTRLQLFCPTRQRQQHDRCNS
jgi:hypothetical protein